MVLYNKELGKLYIPENDEHEFDAEDVYNLGYARGYYDGARQAEEDNR